MHVYSFKFLYGKENEKIYLAKTLKYSLKKLTNVQKVQFSRGLKNVLEKEGEIITRSVILVPITMKNAIRDFLETWKIYYDSREYELMPMLRKLLV